MHKALVLAVGLFLFVSSSFAQTDIVATTTQKWVAGWDHLAEPLNLSKSSVKWTISTARKMTVTFTLSGATP
ncbi:MAG TPA: hypothetical protein VLT90_11385, partial [Terriglobales bacterium]|nr:hypothetical protein [Terriglobales bacterium]